MDAIAFFIFPWAILFVAHQQRQRDDYDFTDYTVLWLAIAFYVGTTLLATIVAHRLQFHKYRLPVIGSASKAFFGCVVFWGFCFPFFLYNWLTVAKGRARPIDGGEGEEGMFFDGNVAIAAWMALWGILFVIYLPGTGISHRRAYESAAVSALRKYGIAQGVFRRWSAENQGVARFCDDYTDFYYREEIRMAHLVPKIMADARADRASLRRIMPGEEFDAPVYHGYRFLEDPFVVSSGDWANQYGLMAYPAIPNATGSMIFWIGPEKKILSRYCEGDTPELLRAEQSPLHPRTQGFWTEVEIKK
jgi:hypothetical protein